MQVEDIVAGESWGCRFRVRTFVDKEGKPVNTRNTPLGAKVPGEPGVYEAWGVIRKRDAKNRLLEIEDQIITGRVWNVKWDDVWEIDRVEYVGDK
jgi:hypothetical protein